VKHSKGAKKNETSIQIWTYTQAQAAAPYITSVVRSLREHALEALAHHRRAQQLADRPGRPNRTMILEHKEAEEQARLADERFEEAVSELQALDIYCLDPIRGQALVPFLHNNELAWYIFDLFDARPFSFWRFQSDPEETRRPVTSMQQDWTPTTTV
jgi:hypothetical protein